MRTFFVEKVMTLDDVLHSALQGPNVEAIVLFDEFYIPVAGMDV